MSFGLTTAGYTAPRASDFLARVRSMYEASTGLTIDWDADSYLGTMSTIVAVLLGELGEASQALYDAFDVNNASGLQLDNLALVVNVTRTPASYSRATVTLTGTVGTFIPEGSLVEGGGSDDHARWATTADITLATTSSDTIVVQAEDVGAVAATTATITTIVTPIAGWTGVSNADPADAGEPRESDTALRKRRQQSLQNAGSRSLNALRANILAVEGVTAAVVVDNPTSSTATVEGLSLSPHSVAIVVYPDSLTDDQQEAVAQAIYDHVAAGIATNGTDVVATVTGADGFAKTVRYDFATENVIDVVTTITVLAAGYEVADVEDEITEKIADYFLALDVGEAVRILAVLGLIASVEGVEAATVTLDAGSVDIDPDATTLLVIGTNTVLP